TLTTGPQHIIIAVNSAVAIYSKAGGAPLLQRTLTGWFGNVINAAMVFDPKLIFDQHAGRWLIVALARDAATKRSTFLLSISKTSDPLAGWWNYSLDATTDGTTATNNWADYPGVGIDQQAIYLTAN